MPAAAESRYCLEYQICGSAISRLLFFFPLRVYYDTSLAIHFTASIRPDGKTSFVLRKNPAQRLFAEDARFQRQDAGHPQLPTRMRPGPTAYRESILALWQKEAPEFAGRVKDVKQFPHVLVTKEPGTG